VVTRGKTCHLSDTVVGNQARQGGGIGAVVAEIPRFLVGVRKVGVNI
jgi:hypothetical protein